MTETADVLVVGLGGLGSAAAYHLAARGSRVIGLERFGPAHARGASHGESRGVWKAYFMGAGYVPLLDRAYELWDRLGELRGETFLHRTGGVCVGPSDGALVPAALASARETGLEFEYLDGDEIRSRFPQFRPGPDDVAVWDPSSGYVRPEQVVEAHLALAREHGADLRFDQQVLRIDTTANGVRVRTATAVYEADRLVVAAGAWAPQLLPELRSQISVVRKVMLWFDPTCPTEDFYPGHHPYWIWDGGDGTIGYGHPAVDGPSGGVKAGIHSGGDPADPDHLDRLVTERDVKATRTFLADRIPALAGRYLRSRVCMYDNSPDLGFIIGPSADSDRITVVAGTSGHAFKFAPALGEAIAELATKGASTHDISLFDPRRLTGATA
jgi:sarcosine oxidase